MFSLNFSSIRIKITLKSKQSHQKENNLYHNVCAHFRENWIRERYLLLYNTILMLNICWIVLVALSRRRDVLRIKDEVRMIERRVDYTTIRFLI